MFDPIDEIKNKIDIVDLVSQYVQLKKAGRNFKALCPFHREKTPSFIVSPDKQMAYCFGCNKGGDIFKFYMEVEHAEFPEALHALAKRAGVKLEKVDEKFQSYKQKLLQIHEKANLIYKANLFSKDEKKALEYLTQRGLTDEIIQVFSLGYAPDSFDTLYTQLLMDGYSKKELVDASLAVQKEFSPDAIYDKFRNRIMFPIHDIEGNIVAFGGRVLDDSLPKYLNSAETPIYHKSSILFNFHRAKDAIREKDFVLVVEGYMDAIAVYATGLHNVVAVCGTALTDDQVQRLKRLTSRVFFCFDNDNAGIEAAKRNASTVIRQQMVLKIVSLTTYKDPDECIRHDQKAFLSTVEHSQDFMEFLIDTTRTRYDTGTMEGRRGFVSEVFPFIKIFPFEVEKDFYVKKIADLLGSSPTSVLNDVGKLKDIEKRDVVDTGVVKKFDVAHYIIGLLLTYPSLLPIVRERLPNVDFPSEFLKNIYNLMEGKYNNQSSVSLSLEDSLSDEEKARVNILKLLVEDQFGGYEEEEMEKEFEKLLERYGKILFIRHQKEYLIRIREAKSNGDEQAHETLLHEYHTFLDANTPHRM